MEATPEGKEEKGQRGQKVEKRKTKKRWARKSKAPQVERRQRCPASKKVVGNKGGETITSTGKGRRPTLAGRNAEKGNPISGRTAGTGFLNVGPKNGGQPERKDKKRSGIGRSGKEERGTSHRATKTGTNNAVCG